MKSLSNIKRFASNKKIFQNFNAHKNIERTVCNETFKYDDLKINLALSYQRNQVPEPSSLTFGTTFSDHMLEVEWTHTKGWGTPLITPLHHFQMHPGSKILHYAPSTFEGMKAFRSSKGTVSLFRPELNMKRFVSSSERVALPTFDGEELLKCIKKLVSIDKRWVPDHGGSSLYIRPTHIAIENSLGVALGNHTLLYVVTCPVGPYFKSQVTGAVSLLADPKYVRACPGGAGSFKLSANYAPTLFVQKLAQKQGLDQVLWLYGDNHQIAEAGAMNIFIFLQKAPGKFELVTPPLDGTILPGVTRQSVLDLTREWKEFEVTERIITMNELIETNNEKRLLEVFLCGTAASICPVKFIKLKDEGVQLRTMEHESPLYVRLLKAITDIQYGRVESEWLVPVE